jgi:hypothetical protein
MAVHLVGSLPHDFQSMLRDVMRTTPDKWSKMTPVDINNLPPVDDNAWFACVSSRGTEMYYFPLCEEENWDNGVSQRVLYGMRCFENIGFKTYKIQ